MICPVVIWFGLVCSGLAWSVGLVWSGFARSALVWFDMPGCRLVWFALDWLGLLVWFGLDWRDVRCFGLVWIGLVTDSHKSRPINVL